MVHEKHSTISALYRPYYNSVMKSFLVCCFCLASVANLHAQQNKLEKVHLPLPSKYMLRQWTTEDGLPANYLTHLYQSSDGYLWIGSHHGLARFDGERYDTYTALNANGWEIGNKISTICEDSSGDLWFNAGLVHSYNLYKIDHFTRESLMGQ